MPLGGPYTQRVILLLELIDVLDSHEARFVGLIAAELRGHRGYTVIQELPGVEPTLSAVFVAEVGDVHRFADPAHLCSWAGPTPKHRESFRGGAPRAHYEAGLQAGAVGCGRGRPTTSHDRKISADKDRIETRRGKNIAKVAAARKQLTLVYYGLRDGHIRTLHLVDAPQLRFFRARCRYSSRPP